ncbi:Kinesin-like protein [Klebsormidium nitens]|uniref:Kinesin-like protein n=1 Tax=Klebsormidium nitens TaxID=105231 RepID=A0A1Y1ILB6_KLENI|nr:Kinesin-like protein [Klebsormidium nitens]|eukprot:GAQ89427.1 Kinesin-like protein [Klebsormidium nitens]
MAPSRPLPTGPKAGSFASTKAFNARLKAKASETSLEKASSTKQRGNAAKAGMERALVVSKGLALSPIEESPIRDGPLLLQEGQIMVYVRLRPMSRKEKEQGAMQCVDIPSDRDVALTEFCAEGDYLRSKRLKGRHFTFDVAFPETATQQEVYRLCAAPLVEVVLEGRNASVFCYGATGAGKTHTMLGRTRDPGVMVLALQDLFERLAQRSTTGEERSVKLSYLEVYNETVKDLLAPGRPLVLRDGEQGITAAGLTQFTASSAVEVMSLLQRGNQNRTTEATRSNETSSRSHAILQVFVECTARSPATGGRARRCGKLSLIDLAGSERALATDARTVRSLEGANINKSLLALSSCIRALVDGKGHVPYRNSKLTQLLKDSLGGACHTAMIANISPAHQQLSETQNTLHWADRAKEIRTKAPQVTCDDVPPTAEEHIHVISSIEKENVHLRAQLEELQKVLNSGNIPTTSEMGGTFMGTPQSANRPPPYASPYGAHPEPPNPFVRSSSRFGTGYGNREVNEPPAQSSPGGVSQRERALEEENRALVEQLSKAEMQRRVAQAESRAAGIDAEALRRRVRSLENESEEYRLQATGLEQKSAELQQRVRDLEAVLDRTGSAVKKTGAEARLQGHVEELERELEAAAGREKFLSDRVLGLEEELERAGNRAAARKLWELEEEVRILREKERGFEATVAALSHDHAVKLKQKDDFIRQVMKEKNEGGNRKWGGSVGVGKEDVRPGCETPSWCKIPRAGGAKMRAGSPPLTVSPGHDFLGLGKKRTFWDITNTAGSPSQSGRKRTQLVAKSAPVLTFSTKISKLSAPSPR